MARQGGLESDQYTCMVSSGGGVSLRADGGKAMDECVQQIVLERCAMSSGFVSAKRRACPCRRKRCAAETERARRILVDRGGTISIPVKALP